MIEVIVILIIFSLQDIRGKRLSGKGLCIAFVLTAAVTGVRGNLFPNGLMGMMLGIVLLLVSKLTREQIGYGDALVLMITGMLLGLRRNLELFFLALLLASVYAGYLLIAKRRKTNHTIAFVPFLAAAEVLLLTVYIF